MINVAVVGCGRWGRNLVRVFASLEGARLAACCNSRDAGRLDELRSLYPGVETTQDFARVLDDPGVDAVVLATPDPTHFEMGRRALVSGKHLFVEKPMALSLAEAEELVELAEARGRVLMTGYVMLYHPAVRWLKGEIEAGSITPRSVLSTRVDFGVGRADADLLWSSAIHDVSIVQHLLDAEPEEVHAVGSSLGGGAADTLFANLAFPGGAVAHVWAGFAGPARERRLVLHSEQAVVSFDGVTGGLKVFRRAGGGAAGGRDYDRQFAEDAGAAPAPGEPLGLECRDFIDAITNNGSALAGGRKALAVIRTLDRLERALQRGPAGSR